MTQELREKILQNMLKRSIKRYFVKHQFKFDNILCHNCVARYYDWCALLNRHIEQQTECEEYDWVKFLIEVM